MRWVPQVQPQCYFSKHEMLTFLFCVCVCSRTLWTENMKSNSQLSLLQKKNWGALMKGLL